MSQKAQEAARAVAAQAAQAAEDACALRALLNCHEPVNENQSLMLAAALAAASAAAAAASAAALLLAQLELGASHDPAAAPDPAGRLPAAEAVGLVLTGTAATGEAHAQTAALGQWMRGVTAITEGAAELQRHLDVMNTDQPVVVSWHAAWSPQCLEAERQLAELACQHPGTAFFVLDVEGSAANTALALQKVMARPESRRPGAKPTLRSGEKWPCLTLHWPSTPGLLPAGTYCGPLALQQLAEALEEQVPPAAAITASDARSPTGARLAQAQPVGVVEAEPRAVAANPGLNDPASTAEHQAQPQAAVSVPCGPVELHRGASELKELLLAGKAAGAPVALVWTQGDSGGSAECTAMQVAAAAAAAAAGGGGLNARLALAAASASKANERLAEALGVTSLPSVFVYRDMKLETRLAGREATPEALLRLLQVPAAPGGGMAGAEGGDAAAGRTLPSGQPAQAVEGGSEDPFAPPEGKFARKGAIKRLPDNRVAHFYPRMPCLRCGCPWWDSEDWDAKCVRCGWDCEAGGYDDDSNPLPRYQKKWEAYVATIAAGKTPAYSHAE